MESVEAEQKRSWRSYFWHNDKTLDLYFISYIITLCDLHSNRFFIRRQTAAQNCWQIYWKIN